MKNQATQSTSNAKDLTSGVYVNDKHSIQV